eukprot:CAMPEP_0172048206 /NCGR_PEP_ID=MMETSP1043-20130122/1410_1 /TAXON_ID=464988 /ORGANISM="Hemiselmis andersenii, Strain CCMP441" /LENGTH=412 /DNA_ID=CAMNT_0012707095 /DNA_START=56 /DNA_END=1294 /DNA_ORIENTATION=-
MHVFLSSFLVIFCIFSLPRSQARVDGATAAFVTPPLTLRAQNRVCPPCIPFQSPLSRAPETPLSPPPSPRVAANLGARCLKGELGRNGWRNDGDGEAEARRAVPGRSFPLPVVLGSIGSNPLLPGAIVRIPDPTQGQTRALQIAQAFATTDDKFASKPLLIYLSQAQEQSNIRGVGDLVTIEDLQVDRDGSMTSVALAAVDRVEVGRVRMVNQTLMVSDQWHRLVDEIKTTSYMHTLEKMRVLADEASAEHNKRRQLMASITAKTRELQLCDIGSCDVAALQALGPQVYNKAMELAAASSQDEGSLEVSHALWSLEALTAKSIARSRPWDELWPQFGDEIDDELKTLRQISFTAWRTLETSLSRDDLIAIISSTDPVKRLRKANERLTKHREELEEVERVLQTLQTEVAKGK